MKCITMIVCVASLIWSAAVAKAAGPFDGDWKGSASGISLAAGGSRGCVGEIVAKVNGNSVTGTTKIQRLNPVSWQGTIAPDGTFSTSGGQFTGKFAGNSFTGTFPNGSYCGNWRVTMSR
jgi:hypothetical protein